MKSKTKIDKKASRKTDAKLKSLIISLKKQNKLNLASLLAEPRRKSVIVNIEKISRETKPDDEVIVPGKVLGKGEMQHSVTIAAYSFSEEARKKLKSCKIVKIEQLGMKNAKIIT